MPAKNAKTIALVETTAAPTEVTVLPPPPTVHEGTLGAVSIEDWCRAVGIDTRTYYRWKRDGLTPREVRIGGVIRITHREWIAWEDARLNPTDAEAEAQRQADARLKARGERARKAAR
jgi:predicted DNA-binding transcriptional regulator AlpA